MLRVLLIKTAYVLINPFRKIYWFIFRPNTRGVKCLVQYQDKFLLTRLNYAHKKWTIPGGGVGRSETFEEAAIREINEEVGIKLLSLKKIGSYQNVMEYKKDTVEVFHSRVDNDRFSIDPVEIKEAGWFNLSELPLDRVPRVDKIIKMFRDYEKN